MWNNEAADGSESCTSSDMENNSKSYKSSRQGTHFNSMPSSGEYRSALPLRYHAYSEDPVMEKRPNSGCDPRTVKVNKDSAPNYYSSSISTSIDSSPYAVEPYYPEVPKPRDNEDGSLSTQKGFLESETDNKGLKPKRSKHDRDMIFKNCLCTYFKKQNTYRSEVDPLLSAIYHSLRKERFAKSPLAFEAYFYDYLGFSKYCSSFMLTDIEGKLFVTQTTQDQTLKLPSLQGFEQILPYIAKECYRMLLTKPGFRDATDNIAEHVADSMKSEFAVAETVPLCRVLVLVACIRNLKNFIFDRYNDSIKAREDVPQPDNPSIPQRKPTPTALQKPFSKVTKNDEELKRRVVQLLSKILGESGTMSKSQLKAQWFEKAPKDLIKYMGSGVSFTLSLRNFESCFPVTQNGVISMKELEVRKYLQYIPIK